MTRDKMIKVYSNSKELKDNPNKEKILEVINIVVQGLSSGLSENVIKRQINQLLN